MRIGEAKRHDHDQELKVVMERPECCLGDIVRVHEKLQKLLVNLWSKLEKRFWTDTSTKTTCIQKIERELVKCMCVRWYTIIFDNYKK
jgi:uncharacterized protein (DUF1015 family)